MRELDKFSKVASILQAVLMYFVYFCWGLGIALIYLIEDIPDLVTGILYAVGFTSGAIAMFIGFVNMVVSGVNIFLASEASPLKTVTIVKLSLVPWYLINFVCCGLMLGGMMNPFLILGIPFVFAGQIAIAFFYMLYSGVPALFYLLRLSRQKKIVMDGTLITATVFQFFFILDVIGIVLLYRKLENKNA